MMNIKSLASYAIVLGCAACVSATTAEEQDFFRVDESSRPVWKTITVPAGTTAVPIYSLATKYPIGTLSSGDSFLAFGKNANIVTLAYNGKIGFVEAKVCEDKFPSNEKAIDIMNFPLPGKTLDDRLKENKNDLDTIQKDGSIHMYFGNDPVKAGYMKKQEEKLKKKLEESGMSSSSSSGNGNASGGMMGPGGGGGGMGGMR